MGSCRIDVWCKSDHFLSAIETFLREKNANELKGSALAGSVPFSKSPKLSALKILAMQVRT